MRKISLLKDRLKSTVLPGTKRTRAFWSNHKKLSFGSAAVLAMLAAPFAAPAVESAFSGDAKSPDSAAPTGSFIPSNSDVQSSADDKQSPHGSDIRLESKSESSNGGDSTVDVTVNGQAVPVPNNGSVHKRMTTNGSETIVDVNINNGAGSNGSSTTNTTVEIDHFSGSDNRGGRYDDRRSERR